MYAMTLKRISLILLGSVFVTSTLVVWAKGPLPKRNALKHPIHSIQKPKTIQEAVTTEEEGALSVQLGVNKSQYLPPEMYGTWSIQARVIRADDPTVIINSVSTEMWGLEQEAEIVVLSNISNSARANINVEKVQGNTATFHHKAIDEEHGLTVLETPTITVDGDHLSGINRQEHRFYSWRGHLKKVVLIDLAIEGSRLSPAKKRFGGYTAPESPEFEVAPLQFK
jgi:hypothetical protein